jgi:hypothetical protein
LKKRTARQPNAWTTELYRILVSTSKDSLPPRNKRRSKNLPMVWRLAATEKWPPRFTRSESTKSEKKKGEIKTLLKQEVKQQLYRTDEMGRRERLTGALQGLPEWSGRQGNELDVDVAAAAYQGQHRSRVSRPDVGFVPCHAWFGARTTPILLHPNEALCLRVLWI